LNIIEKIRSSGIESAIIVDDGYDDIPQVDELAEEDAWDSFFDDSLYGENFSRIKEIYSDFNPSDREELKWDQEFVTKIWNSRESIGDLLGDLFYSYENKKGEISKYLKKVESTLSDLQIEYTTCGRDFVDASKNVDLIIIDLFLGIQQTDNDRKFTVERLKQVIEMRGNTPLPSIVLMSQVSSITELAKGFRMDAKLYASSFRHVKKGELSKTGLLAEIILTLATHRSDSQLLSGFVETWERNAINAVKSAALALRKVDIDDLLYIRNMLLRFEGVNTSSYLLDVYDRILQYEIEDCQDVLNAALAIDEISQDAPPLMISNDRDTYSIIEKTLYVNLTRRLHSSGAQWPITFGDVLGCVEGGNKDEQSIFGGRTDLVFFVASPECDFIREGGLKTALLVPGRLVDINPGSKFKIRAQNTPVITIGDNERFQVEWDFSDLRTISLEYAVSNIETGCINIIAKFREGVALSLRQELLNNIGRIGEPAPVPRSMWFKAVIYFPSSNKGYLHKVELADGIEVTGNILIPRSGSYALMVFDSNCEDDLRAALLELDPDKVSSKSRNNLNTLKDVENIRKLFRTGLVFDFPLTDCKAAGLVDVEKQAPSSDDKKPPNTKVGTIVDGKSCSDIKSVVSDKSGVVVVMYVD
tara:strand:- start:5554 stop:7485 length:1932 start_codon:yes stop_codon:yes gene_type:complete